MFCSTSPSSDAILSRGGAVAARRAHNPKVVGSNPTPATNQARYKNAPFHQDRGLFLCSDVV